MLSFEESKKWLESLRNEQTHHNYTPALFTYCQEVGLSPSDLIAEKAKSTQNINLRGLAEDRLVQWHRKKEQTAPAIAVQTFKAVRAFFKANYLPLGCRIPSYTSQRETEYVPNGKEVKAMCKLANLETATFLLVAAESGRRDGTIADVKVKHFDFASKPTCFIIPQKRNQHGKIVRSKRIYGKFGFICSDATEKLQLLIKTKNLKSEDKIFPMEAPTYSKKIGDLGEEIGINPKGGKGLKPFHTHCLRKMAQTVMEEFIPLNWVDRILGYKPRGSQASAYSMPPKHKLAAKYVLAMPALRIYGEEAANTEIGELKARVEKLEGLVSKLADVHCKAT